MIKMQWLNGMKLPYGGVCLWKSHHSFAGWWSFNQGLSLLIEAQSIEPEEVCEASLMAMPMHMMMRGIWGSTPRSSIELARSSAEALAAFGIEFKMIE